MLKSKWTAAMIIASRVVAFSVTAINPVMVVPTFAPTMNGTACFNETSFLATIGTTSDVVIVLERIAAVVTAPQLKDFQGRLKKNLLNF